jgi:hypothetical protein
MAGRLLSENPTVDYYFKKAEVRMKRWLSILLMLIITGFFLSGCSKENNTVTAPVSDSQQAAKLVDLPGNTEKAVSILQKHNPKLLSITNVVGTGIIRGVDGKPAILVMTKSQGVTGIPKFVDSVPVEIEVTGEIRALAKKPPAPPVPPTPTIDPRAWFARAVPIGVSTGNINEISSGTIGCRVKDSSRNVYALSNNHVYARENSAELNEIIVQPGRYDTAGYARNESNKIGKLSAFIPIQFTSDNIVDVAIAISTKDDLGTGTPANGYGVPSSTLSEAELGQAVQKYGRTTALTKGTIKGVDVTILVSYTDGNATFTNQIMVQGRGFIKAGDSGSLLVTDPGCSPVGLLFAGDSSGRNAFANPIGDVLDQLSEKLGATLTIDNGTP